MQQVCEINTAISNKATLQQGWDDFIQKNLKQYFNSISPANAINNRYIRAGFNQMGIAKLFLNKQYLKLISIYDLTLKSYIQFWNNFLIYMLMRGFVLDQFAA